MTCLNTEAHLQTYSNSTSIFNFLANNSWSQIDDDILEELLKGIFNSENVSLKLRIIDRLFLIRKFDILTKLVQLEKDKKIQKTIIIRVKQFFYNNYLKKDVFDENLEIQNLINVFSLENSFQEKYSNSLEVIKHIKVKKIS